MRSVVTGCAGFIGSHLAERLIREGHEVVGIDCFTDYYSKEIKTSNMETFVEDDSFSFIEGDLLELDLTGLMEDIDYVFHLAAQPGVRQWGRKAALNYVKNNILTTLGLLEACRDKKLGKFVYAGSSSVYGDMRSLPMREKDIPAPISTYGVTKLAGENLCRAYWKNFGVPVVSLRYFTAYGPRQRPDMAFNKFLRAIHEGREITIYGDGKQTRDFTHVSDIVAGTLLATKSLSKGEVFNIGGGSRSSLLDVVTFLEKYSGKQVRLKYIDSQRGDPRDTHADISRAKEVLGYSPLVSIEEGIEDFVNWFDGCQGFE